MEMWTVYSYILSAKKKQRNKNQLLMKFVIVGETIGRKFSNIETASRGLQNVINL